MSDYTVALAGNPNVGKSTIFNNLTGMHQHTGNWTGKTVANATGTTQINGKEFLLVDIPGTYSLMSSSKEEEIARDYICSGDAKATVVVVDVTCLERNLNLVFQIMEITDNVILCANLMDEAKKKKIKVDLDKLEELLGVPVVGTTARDKRTLKKLQDTIYKVCEGEIKPQPKIDMLLTREISSSEEKVSIIMKRAEEITREVCTYENQDYGARDRKIDKILTSKKFGIPIMILFLGVIFWITIVGANYPSQLLFDLFNWIQDKLIILQNTYIHQNGFQIC